MHCMVERLKWIHFRIPLYGQVNPVILNVLTRRRTRWVRHGWIILICLKIAAFQLRNYREP